MSPKTSQQPTEIYALDKSRLIGRQPPALMTPAGKF
jgi:hypothetical protein